MKNHKKSRRKKGRSLKSLQNKIKKITKWYNHIVKNRQEKDGLGKPKKELKPLNYFLDNLKKSNKEL